MTALGKQTFGIPSTLEANVTTGKGIYGQNCSGCHGEKTSRSFSSLRSSIAKDPMFFDSTSMPDSDLAHITAYLNRFRL